MLLIPTFRNHFLILLYAGVLEIVFPVLACFCSSSCGLELLSLLFWLLTPSYKGFFHFHLCARMNCYSLLTQTLAKLHNHKRVLKTLPFLFFLIIISIFSRQWPFQLASNVFCNLLSSRNNSYSALACSSLLNMVLIFPLSSSSVLVLPCCFKRCFLHYCCLSSW